MRILHAVHDYLPDQVAGVEVYTNRIARRQSTVHDTAVLFTRIDPARSTGTLVSPSDPELTLFGIAQNRDWHAFEQTWSDARMLPAIESALDDFAPDVVHVQHLMNLGTGLVEAASRRDIPIVMTLHDQWLACAAGGQRIRRDRTRCDDLDARRCGVCTASQVGGALALRGALQRHPGAAAVPGLAQAKRIGRTLASLPGRFGGARRIEARWKAMRAMSRSIGLFIVPSRDLLEEAVAFGLSRDALRHVPHGLPEMSTPARDPAEQAKRFGVIGSVVPHKGLHVAIEAFSAMPADATLEIVGSLEDDPGYVQELRGRVRHPGIEFRGEVAPERVASILEALDVLIAPSIWRENAPLGVQEAFRMRRPVVATSLGGHVELLGKGGGLLVPPDDVPALAGALRRCIEEPGLVRSLARSVPKVASLDDHLVALETAYHEAGARAGGGCEARGGDVDSRDALPSGVRAVFLDRDGVVNLDRDDYVRRLEDWKPIPGSLEAIARLSRAGYRVAVVTNQSGIGRGFVDPAELERIHDTLRQRVEALGGTIEAIFACPHTPQDGCRCRKPEPGLIEQACDALGLEAAEVVVVGDRVTDLAAAHAAGAGSIFVRSGSTSEEALAGEWSAVARFDDLAGVADALLDGPRSVS